MRAFVSTLLWLLAIPASLWVWSEAGRLMRQPSDLAVAGGLALYAALLAGALLAVRTLVRRQSERSRFLPILAAVALLGTGTGCTKVEPGYVGIVVNQYGDQRGVEDFPVHTGRVWYNPITEDVHKFPTFQQRIVWTRTHDEGDPVDQSITFNSIEGAAINVDVGVALTFQGDRVPAIFVEFRREAAEIVSGYVGRVPDRGYAGSCIFHGEKGCTLPREWRSNVCNTYFCGNLGAFIQSDEPRAPTVVIAGELGNMRMSSVIVP